MLCCWRIGQRDRGGETVHDYERKLLELAPAVWFLAESFKRKGFESDRDRIMAAASHFRKLTFQEQQDSEAMGRLYGVAMGILQPDTLDRLNPGWDPDWIFKGETEAVFSWDRIGGIRGK